MAAKATKYAGASVITPMAMAQLTALSAKELIEHAKLAVKTAVSVKRDNADLKATFPMLGKIIAALTAKFNSEAADGKGLASVMTFPAYFESLTGAKPNNHAQSCAKAFGAYVNNGLITEKDYDNCSTDWLEKAAVILDEVKLDLTSEHVINAAEVMKERPKDGAKKLQAILDTIRGPKTIDKDKAEEYMRLIFASGHTNLAFASCAAEIPYITDAKLRDHVAGHVSVMVDALNGKSTPKAPAQPAVVTHESWTKENCADVDPEYLPQAVESVKAFCESNKRFPADRAELDNWLDAQDAESESAEVAAGATAS